MATSTAVVVTDRPDRYGKQLCSHLGRKVDAAWDAEAGTGRVVFGRGLLGGAPTCSLTASEEGLRLVVEARAKDLAEYEDVVGRHLVRFGAKDELTCTWMREDGSPGTTQRYVN